MKDFDLVNFPTSESAKRQLSYVSEGFYEKSYVGKWLFQVMGMEYDEARKLVEELPYQMFPETATWGLKYHELKWQLPVRENLSYEERRKVIYQKRDSKTSMTPYRMERYLESITGLKVYVTDVHDLGKFSNGFSHPNMFHVTIIGGSELDLAAVKSIIDRRKQSHTVYTIEVLENCYEVLHCIYEAIVPQTKKTYEVEVV